MCVILCVARRDQRALCKVASIVPGTAQIELRAGKGYSGLEEDGCAACVPLKMCVSLLWSWNTEWSGELSIMNVGQERLPRA